MRAETRGIKTAPLNEPDNVILESEGIVEDLNTRIQRCPAQRDTVLAEAASQLTGLWSKASNTVTKPGSMGPESSDGVTNANYLASLLLQLYYPHSNKSAKPATRNPRSLISTERATTAVPVPKALLEWLETYHKPFPDDYDYVRAFRPTPSAQEAFWDVLFANILRGKLGRAARLLENAGWEHACTAEEDKAYSGYTDQQIEYIDEVVDDCIKVLEACPGYKHDDWDVRSLEWTTFRQRAIAMLEKLASLAEGDGEQEENMFERSMRGRGQSLSSSVRKAESKVPWSIYENLKLVYGILTGSVEEVMMTAQDWLEGSLYLTIWWDGTNEEDMNESLSKSSTRRRTVQSDRLVDGLPKDAYRVRLARAFDGLTANPQDSVFQIDTLDLVQLGLGCVLEGSLTELVDLLRTWSMPVTVSVVELGTLGRWIECVGPRNKGGLGFDSNNLLAMSVTQGPPDGLDVDQLLSEYADLLAAKREVDAKEGWELSVAVLNRLDQTPAADDRIGNLLQRLDLAEEARVGKVLQVCDDLGQVEQRRNIAKRFADSLDQQGLQVAGTILMYYARAQAETELKDRISTLTASCLAQSAAFPQQSALDETLAALISKDRPAMKALAKIDLEAATLLSSQLSGYATLRRYYDIRDQEIYISQGIHIEQPLRSLERRRAAASALFATITSAADCISGGLYDPEVESVVPADGILTLLGESLPLLGGGQRIFTEQQIYALLSIVEDFHASPFRIKENADSLLTKSLELYKDEASTAFRASKGKKSKIDLSASSSWDMIGSVMAQSQSGEWTKITRAWDWRQGLLAIGDEVDRALVVRLVREGLVKEVAAGWGGSLKW
ncbi:hypothetical protein DOTSEDRAFT_148840 [Dothistroma septosporum NZE10]|uniref:Nuclear pore complex protein Nup85 n=1 Tax=Dothistroma septosporum (strain NZE10 / CBS 128990) TaxID=675120 RepID=N1PVW4_DOTSN|nr:hypothetical protein DOTSEDRAFT_148840 [Dothistroma septosporum NZE10]